jgi:serine/threonine-protein kinase
MHPAPTTTRIGRYEVLAPLGRGAMGVVYQARDPQIDRLVAIKTILWMGDEPDDAHDYRQRFIQEAKAAGRLSHPGIVQVFDVGQDSAGAPFLVMEYVAGQSLNKLLAASAGTKLPLQDALRLTEEIASALAYAHSQGVVHRDIKPANILVTEDGHAKIADFGVAKLDFSNLTIAGHAVGTPAYMAPEQLAGERVDGRADLFSLGVILYSMVAGFRPFQGRGNSTIAHKVRHGEPLPVSMFDVQLPPEVDTLIAKAMAKDPAERFQSGAEMAAAIRKLRSCDAQTGSSTDAKAVMQETRAHVACMAEKSGTSHGTVQEKPVAPPMATPPPVVKTVKPAAVKPAKPAAPKVSLPSSQKAVAWRSSRTVLATTLAASLLAATALAWRLHDSMQPQPAPEPVAWESAPPTPAATTTPIATPPQPVPDSAAPQLKDDAAPTSAPKRPAASATIAASKKTPKPKESKEPSDEAADTVADRTVKFTRVSAPSPTLAKVSATSAKAPAATTKPSPAADSAILQVALEHAFDEAQVTVWIGDHQALTQTVRGEKKRMLVFQRTRGTFMDKVPVSTGQHLVRVRVQSPSESFDVSQSVSGDFTKSSQYVLHARCDKKRKELKLNLEPVTVTSAAK